MIELGQVGSDPVSRRLPRKLEASPGALHGLQPSEAVEFVEHRGPPVVRGVALDLQQRLAAARPVERTVRLVPGERLASLDLRPGPIPGPPVEPRMPAVEPGGQRQPYRPGGQHQRATGKRVAPAKARQPQPGRDEQEQDEAVPQRHGGGVDRGRGRIGTDQDHQGRDAGARHGAAPGPEGERGRKSEPERQAEQDRQPRPLIRAAVRIVVVADRVQPRSQVVPELAPSPGRQQAGGHADRKRGRRHCEERRHHGERPGRGSADGGPGDQCERNGAGDPGSNGKRCPTDRGIGDQSDPLGGGERGERREGAQPHRDRVAWLRACRASRLAHGRRPRPQRAPRPSGRRGGLAHAATDRARRAAAGCCPWQPATVKVDARPGRGKGVTRYQPCLAMPCVQLGSGLGRGHPEDRLGPRQALNRGRGAAGLDHGQVGVDVGPRPELRVDLQRTALARHEQRASAGRRQVDADRGRRANRGVKRVLIGRIEPVQHHERRRVGAGDQPVLHHLAGAGHGRPVDARRWAAVAVRTQPVDLEVDRPGVEPRSNGATWAVQGRVARSPPRVAPHDRARSAAGPGPPRRGRFGSRPCAATSGR